jgi:HSP20 family protein
MPNVRYYNNTAPFWDFIASLEGQGFNHTAFER